jgi:hypothetical protein
MMWFYSFYFKKNDVLKLDFDSSFWLDQLFFLFFLIGQVRTLMDTESAFAALPSFEYEFINHSINFVINFSKSQLFVWWNCLVLQSTIILCERKEHG